MKRLLCALNALMLLGSFACAETLARGHGVQLRALQLDADRGKRRGPAARGRRLRRRLRRAHRQARGGRAGLWTSRSSRPSGTGWCPRCSPATSTSSIAGMSPTAERMATIDFTDPYYESELVIVVRKDGAYAEATSLADFAGAKITGQLNTFHYTVIDQIPDVQKQTAMDTIPTMVVALTSGVHRRLHLRAPRRGERRGHQPRPDVCGICRRTGL